MCHLGGKQNEDSLSVARSDMSNLLFKSKPKIILLPSLALDSQTTENSASSEAFPQSSHPGTVIDEDAAGIEL